MAVALVLASGVALAAGREIPQAAVKAVMQVDAAGGLRLGRDAVVAGAGAQIRDADNRIVQPSHLRGEYRVRVFLDASGQLHRAWILTAEEAATPEPRRLAP